MKRRGRHPEKALTSVQVRSAKGPGRYADGHGLYLVVDPSGAKRWLLRIVVRGRRRDIGLGSASLVSLAEARERALSSRKLARDGGDPVAERKKERIVVPTFAEATEIVHADHKKAWKNEKHAAQWISTLRMYANPAIGSKPVDRVETPDILKALAPIWLAKPETARRTRQRIGTVLDWAKAAGYRSGENPIEGVLGGLPRQHERVKHHSALPYPEVPAFLKALDACDVGIVPRLAFEFLILTACRTGEVVGARRSEIFLDQRLWVIPANRMKTGRDHRVPLSRRLIEIVHQLLSLERSAFLFPGRTSAKPLSNMVFLMILRRMSIDVTAHGFRSSFRDWAAEATAFPREVAEMALAHVVSNKVEAAYRRGDLLEKRRDLMQAWQDFAGTCDDNR